jgi:serine protease Do
MTNYHVVEYADPKNSSSKNATLEVFLPDKRQAKATFIGGDSKTDLAIIKISLNELPVAELGDSSKLEVGDLAVAIGNPLGMEFAGSVTAGVISALNRQVETDNKTLTLIQTDAAINPGNSGGALVNSQGQVIGINTIKISVSGVEGLGFAIPINDAKPIIEQLVSYGYVKDRPFIGISGKEISSIMAQQYGLPQGIYITEVSAGSGAQTSGIKKGDVLVSIAEKEIKTMKDLEDIKKQYKAGDSVAIVVVRNNLKQNLTLVFSEEK